MSKKSKARVAQDNNRKLARTKFWLLFFPLTALFIKFIVMANSEAGGWLGADGENYLTGVDGLLKDGFFSTEGKLIYWPAGYPLFVWPFAKISIANFIYFISFFQSVLYAFATYILVRAISQTKVNKAATWSSFIISFNPTLSLSSLAIGYESPVASLLMITTSLILRDIAASRTVFSTRNVVASGLCLSISTFFQPRIILFAVALTALWIISKESHVVRIKISAAMLILTMLFPSALILRNVVANDQAAISTNLGVTMRIGAGDKATGGYGTPDGSIPCLPKVKDQPVTDNQVVVCVLKWYIGNPVKAAELMINKSRFYWSPWFGPEANGTMARNPWLKISPLVGFTKNEDGFNLVYGTFGKIISLAWLLGGILLMSLGFLRLWDLGGLERQFGLLAGAPVILGWLTSLGTIGDHRFRIPQMGLSLFLQVIGALYIRDRVKRLT
jgi:hypothetical protein